MCHMRAEKREGVAYLPMAHHVFVMANAEPNNTGDCSGSAEISEVDREVVHLKSNIL